MNRRRLLSIGVCATMTLSSGCLSSGEEKRAVLNNPWYPADDHENHIAELTTEINRRDVEIREAERRGETVVVDYDSDNLNDDLAEVAMAFVERIEGGWGIDKLDAIARDDEDWTWHAEANWARQYLEGEIDASEYGRRISGTLERTLVLEGEANDGSE